MSETTGSTTSSDHSTGRSDASVDNLVESLVNLGTVWVRYGITVGRLALKTHAQMLSGVSHLLDQVADALEPATHIGEAKPTATADAREPQGDTRAS